MDCPRCNFNQPDDKYCANCGLDIEAYNRRPIPLWMRIFQDPNFYAILFGGILILTAGYIFLNQRSVGRQVGKLFHNTFVLSKDARVPSEDSEEAAPVKRTKISTAPSPATEAALAAPSPAAEPTQSYTRMTVRFFEMSKEIFTRENLTALNGRVVREDGDWRVVYFEDAKTIESIKSSASRLPGAQEKQVQSETLELDAGDVNPDLQVPYLAIGVDLSKTESLHFAVDMQVPTVTAQARNVAGQGAGQGQEGYNTDAPPQAPAPMQVSALEGTVKFKPQGALLMIYDPVNRGPTSQDSSRLSQSPLKVFNSDDFRQGFSDLIVWISLN